MSDKLKALEIKLAQAHGDFLDADHTQLLEYADQLEAENARLRAALEAIANGRQAIVDGSVLGVQAFVTILQTKARTALKGGDK